jgi:hypothetical protein
MRELVAIVVLLVLATANYARITVTNYGDSALNCGITVTVHLIAPGNYAGITDSALNCTALGPGFSRLSLRSSNYSITVTVHLIAPQLR